MPGPLVQLPCCPLTCQGSFSAVCFIVLLSCRLFWVNSLDPIVRRAQACVFSLVISGQFRCYVMSRLNTLPLVSSGPSTVLSKQLSTFSLGSTLEPRVTLHSPPHLHSSHLENPSSSPPSFPAPLKRLVPKLLPLASTSACCPQQAPHTSAAFTLLPESVPYKNTYDRSSLVA